MVERGMSELAQRVASLEAHCSTHSTDITWMKKAYDCIKMRMIRMETVFWVGLTIGQVGLYFLQAWLAR